MTGGTWHIAWHKSLDLATPRVIAILNLTPDSFADAGRLLTPEVALAAADRAIAAGAAMLDIGGESTRPGAQRIDAREQLARVIPAIRAIRARHPDIAISIDTTLASVAREALDAGADAVNDVSAGLEDDDMLPLVAQSGAGMILMHRLLPPGADSYSDRYASVPTYDAGGVVDHVVRFLTGRANAAICAGVRAESIVLDPGLGFGKSVEQNIELIREAPALRALGFPVLSALSKKSFVGRVGLARDSAPSERLAPTLAMSVLHFQAGARLFRVHDVAEHVEALRVAHAFSANKPRA
jgi:dihydropteroate synthase